MQRDCLIAGFLFWIALGIQSSKAQYTADYQTNIISGVTSNWDFYYVGERNAEDVLLIQNGGVLADGDVSISSSNNSVLVTGTGSVWRTVAFLHVGTQGAGNSLVISNGGWVINGGQGVIGVGTSSFNNSVLVTGSGSVWSNGNMMVGMDGAGNSLVISDGGRMISIGGGFVGLEGSSSNNTVQVTGTGSVWSCEGALYFGFGSSGNRLLITGGGQVLSGSAGGGQSEVAGVSNTVLISGPGSVWNDSSLRLVLGFSGVGGNSMVITNGGQLVDTQCVIGSSHGGSNTVRVVDGAVWQNGALTISDQGSSNSVVVAGGSVYATNIMLGAASAVCNNLLQLDSGSVIVTNSTADAVLEVRRGRLVLNGGVLQADTLVITNQCAQLVHNGGALIVGKVVLDPNTFRIVSVVPQSNDLLVTWMMGPGMTNALQVTTGGLDGSYNTNGFSDIFVVTNNAAVGTVTNYLDVGAATNVPSRFYRARLVP